MGEARKVEAITFYTGKNISGEVNQYLESITYEDVASGGSDSISIKLSDDGKLWMGAWYPTKGDRISQTIVFKNWYQDGGVEQLYCGEFEIDDLSFNGRPIACMIGATSIPQEKGFNAEERTKTWEDITLEKLAKEIADRAGIELWYEAGTISIKNMEQDSKTDCKFLYEVCEKYGYAMKVFGNRIIIFDEEKYERKDAIRTLAESDIIKWSYNDTVAGTYTGVVFSFTDPNDDKEYTVKLGNSERVLTINVTADSYHDAELQAMAKLNNENKKTTTMSVTIMADPGIVAGSNVEITGLGVLSGKYFVEKVSLKVSGGGASQMTLSLRKVIARVNTAVNQGGSSIAYTIKSGDTLWALAKKFLGKGIRYKEIYEGNKELIESTAKRRGMKDSDNGHWIFPGTVITIMLDE